VDAILTTVLGVIFLPLMCLYTFADDFTSVGGHKRVGVGVYIFVDVCVWVCMCVCVWVCVCARACGYVVWVSSNERCRMNNNQSCPNCIVREMVATLSLYEVIPGCVCIGLEVES